MDLVRIPGSRIFEIAKLAFATPDVDFLCFGESDQPSPPSRTPPRSAALDAGETKYIDVRGLPPLRAALADYLTALHPNPVAEEPRAGHRLRHGRGVGGAGGDRARRRARGAAQPRLAERRQRRAAARGARWSSWS